MWLGNTLTLLMSEMGKTKRGRENTSCEGRKREKTNECEEEEKELLSGEKEKEKK